MLGNTPQKCTVVAETAASLWTMNRDCFDAFIQDIAKTGELGSCTPALEEESLEHPHHITDSTFKLTSPDQCNPIRT
eukprot:1947900-Amphidinium_carterae.1